MKDNQISITAIMTAYLRAYHATYVTPKIFDDFLAYQIIPEERRLLIEQGLVQSVQPNPTSSALLDEPTALAKAMQEMTGPSNVLSRARYTEDTLMKALNQGVEQYVILGAGLDTFAFRHPELTGEIQVFEVDHPATQAFKRDRLAELNWELPNSLHFVPTDFTKRTLGDALAGSSYNPKAKTVFSWLGVTMYLTKEEVLAVLQDIAKISPMGSMVIFDYLDTDAFVLEKAAPRVQGMLMMAKYAGEPMQTGFDANSLVDELSGSGLSVQENLHPADIQARYFQGRSDGYYACEHVHFAKVAKVASGQ